MTRIYNFIKLLCVITILFSAKIYGQCTSPNSYGSITANGPILNYQNYTNCTFGEEYNTITANVTGVYSFSVDNGNSSPIYLTLKDASNNNLVFGSSPLVYTITSTGTYYLHITETGPPGCSTNQNCHATYLQVLIPGSPTVVVQPVDGGGCISGNASFVTGVTPTAGATYQWQEDQGSGFVNLTNAAPYSGVTTPTLNISGLTGAMNGYMYQCVITNAVATVTTNIANLVVFNNGSFPLSESFDPSTNMPANWVVNPNNQWYVISNHGTGGSNGMSRNLYGSFNVLAEAYSPNVGPATPSTGISFDYRIVEYPSYPTTATPTTAIMNDSLNVYVSTNCGATFTLIGSINASNHNPSLNFVNMSYNLGSYAGNNLIFKFVGKKDPTTSSDYYIDIDNVNIFNLVSNDAGISSFVAPLSNQLCYSSSEPIVVKIKNFGINNLTTIPVSVIVSGAVSQTLTSTYNGNLAPAATANFTVGNLNMLTAGTYSFKPYTHMAAEAQLANDTLFPQFTATVIGTLPLPYSENFGTTNYDLPLNWISDVNMPMQWSGMPNHGTLNSEGLTVNLYGSFSTMADVMMPKMGPATASTAISFDYRIIDYPSYPSTPTSTMDIANDSLNIYVSANCGATYALLGSINAANHNPSMNFVNVSYPLGTYAGSDLIFRFVGVKDPSTTADYYLDVDNINLFNLTATDAGISGLLAPNTSTCFTATQSVSVVLKNFGLGAVSNIPVTVTVTGANNAVLNTTYVPSLPVGGTVAVNVGTFDMSFAGVYTFSATTSLAGDGNSLNDMYVMTYTSSPEVAISGPTLSCIGSSITLNTTGNATTYTWSTNANTSSISVSPNALTVYSLVASAANNCQAKTFFTVSVNNPTISATGASNCGNPATGTLMANAFATSTVNWYASLTSTTSLGSGNSFPVSAAVTTTYYAEASSQTSNTVGLANNSAGGNQQTSTNYNIFDVYTPCVLTSVDVYPGASGNVVVELRDNLGNLITSTSVPVTASPGPVTIPVNFNLNPGQGYRLAQGAGSVSMFRNDQGVNYPYTIPSVLSQTNSAAGNSYYYFFYKWNVVTLGCTSPKIPVVFTVTAVSAATTNTLLCSGNSATLTATGATNYTWMPGNLTTSSVVVTPSSSTNYTVTGVSPSCTTTAVQSISVNPSPVLTVPAAPGVSICPSMSATLSATSSVNNYTWTPGNANTSSIVVTPAISTVYNVATTNSLGCTTNSNVTVYVIVCTGLTNNSMLGNNTKVYPNPNNGSINVVIESANGGYTFEVNDLSGRLVYKTTLNTAESALNIKELANGMYTYRITSLTTNTSIKEGKLIKE